MFKEVIRASSVLLGTIIGVGIFGVPYVASKSGFMVAIFYLLFLGTVATVVHLFYAKIVLSSGDGHRLVGHVREYLGRSWARVASVTVVFVRFGSLLVYIIVSGHFLSALLGGSPFWWSLIFFMLGSLAVFFGLKTVAVIEVLLSGFLLFSIVLIFFFGLPHITLANLSGFDVYNFFLPYGVVLFALGGITAIADMEIIAKQNKNPEKTLYTSVIVGTLTAVVVTALFTLAVVGITGPSTTPEALSGLQGFLHPGVLVIGLVFGVVALFTSFLTIGLNLKKILQLDFKINDHLAWGLTCLVPCVIFLLGLTDFIGVMGILGAVFGAMTPIYVSLIYRKVSSRFGFLSYLVIALFVLGAIYEITRKFL